MFSSIWSFIDFCFRPEVRDAPITTGNTLEQRVQRLESLVQDLTLQIQDPSRRQQTTSDCDLDSGHSSEASDEDDIRYGTENMLVSESSPNSYLSNARQDLEQLRAAETFNSNDALKSFSKLSNTFTEGVTIERSSRLKSSDGRRYQGRFFIPDEKDRQPLMQGINSSPFYHQRYILLWLRFQLLALLYPTIEVYYRALLTNHSLPRLHRLRRLLLPTASSRCAISAYHGSRAGQGAGLGGHFQLYSIHSIIS